MRCRRASGLVDDPDLPHLRAPADRCRRRRRRHPAREDRADVVGVDLLTHHVELLAVHREESGPRSERLGQGDGCPAVQHSGRLHRAVVHRHPRDDRVIPQLDDLDAQGLDQGAARHPVQIDAGDVADPDAHSSDSSARSTVAAASSRHVALDVALIGTVVGGQRADEGVGCRLLHDVRRPAGDPRRDEQRREGQRVEAHQVVSGPRRVVEVRVDALARDELRLEGVVERGERRGRCRPRPSSARRACRARPSSSARASRRACRRGDRTP